RGRDAATPSVGIDVDALHDGDSRVAEVEAEVADGSTLVLGEEDRRIAEAALDVDELLLPRLLHPLGAADLVLHRLPEPPDRVQAPGRRATDVHTAGPTR